MRFVVLRRIAVIGLAILLPLLASGCAVVLVAGAAASVAATGASLALDAAVGTVKLTGQAAGTAADWAIPDDEHE